jgi:hypothetical protein
MVRRCVQHRSNHLGRLRARHWIWCRMREQLAAVQRRTLFASGSNKNEEETKGTEMSSKSKVAELQAVPAQTSYPIAASCRRRSFGRQSLYFEALRNAVCDGRITA